MYVSLTYIAIWDEKNCANAPGWDQSRDTGFPLLAGTMLLTLGLEGWYTQQTCRVTCHCNTEEHKYHHLNEC